jgi:iron complex transport system ATP-binding protein
MLVPQQGQVRMFDQDLRDIPALEMARLAATVPQVSEQTFPFTVAETVVMGRFPHRARANRWLDVTWETDEDFAWTDWAMEAMQVSHLADRLLSEVSGGERQRTLVARALAQASRVLLMDEPTTFLDFRHQLDICRTLERVRREQTLTVILVSHDLNLASQCCDRLLLLNRGRLVACGTPEEILVPHLINEAYGCHLLIDKHPETGRPRVCLPSTATV